MQHENLSKSLDAFLRRKPFRGFEIDFVDGESVVVEHPEAVRYQGRGTAVYFGKRGEMMLFDHGGVVRTNRSVKAAKS